MRVVCFDGWGGRQCLPKQAGLNGRLSGLLEAGRDLEYHRQMTKKDTESMRKEKRLDMRVK